MLETIPTMVVSRVVPGGDGELLDAVLDRELPRYAEALERLGK